MAMSTCPTNALPEDQNLTIDSDGIFAVMPRANTTDTDATDPWMIDCCDPSPARLASDNLTGSCWQWCDLPPRYTNLTTDQEDLLDAFRRCVTGSSTYLNSSVKPNIFHVSSSANQQGSGDGIVPLALVLGLAVWRLLM